MNKILTAALLIVSACSSHVQAAIEAQVCIQAPRTAPDGRFEVNQNGTVKDLKTDLTWMRCLVGMKWDGTSCINEPLLQTWQPALQTVKNINTNTKHYLYQFGGVKEWRLPNIKELQSIHESACYQPALNEYAFPNIGKDAEANTGTVWSSTPAHWSKDVFTLSIAEGTVVRHGISNSNWEFATLLVANQ
ncbi:MAG: DUF1566 domain-containing protein [Photobacterium frigidiphilum]|uniref:Lcl C-terminal domain-containing protein n=1 Tax=Photobacterium frigidiphilum TaxID=264736 RepID=UPI0030015E0C